MIRRCGFGNRGSEDWATVIQHEDFHQRDDLEHVEILDSRHLIQPRILHLAFQHHLVSQQNLAHQHGLVVHLEKKTLVHFEREVNSRIPYVHPGVNLIVEKPSRTITK